MSNQPDSEQPRCDSAKSCAVIAIHFHAAHFERSIAIEEQAAMTAIEVQQRELLRDMEIANNTHGEHR